MDNFERRQKHLLREFKEGRRHPTLWAFIHLRIPSLSFSYRGQRVRFYDDDNGQQYYTYLFGKVWSMGSFNLECEAEAKAIIDEKLDHIANVETPLGCPNGEIAWHYGKDGRRKIVLRYDGLVCHLSGNIRNMRALMAEALTQVSTIEAAKAELEDQIKQSKHIDKSK